MIIRVNERQWADQEAFLRQAVKEQRVVAPCCEAALILRWGQRKIRHFAHPARVSCPFEHWGEPESPEHVAGKVLLYDWCRTHLADQTQLLALEYPLRATFQRPDVYLELKDGTRFALEYQRSAISLGEWTERHEGYVSQAIHDIWIFGENRHADAQLSDEQREKWALREPGMLFLKLRAFEGAAMVRTAYDVPYWRDAVQDEQLWSPLELAARVGREVSPWYKRSALERLASVTFMDATNSELSIYRAMRELPAHVDTRMASVVHRVQLDSEGLELTPVGFITPADHMRLAQHLERVSRVEATMRATAASEQLVEPQVKIAPDMPMPADMPPYFQQLARRREQQVSRLAGARTFLLGEQEAEQKRRLTLRAENEHWQSIRDRFGLTPANLFFLVGVPIPDDIVIQVHRTVWQAFVYYRIVRGLRGSFATDQVTDLLGRKFAFDTKMAGDARYAHAGIGLNSPLEVVGRFLELLTAAGYLRNEQGSYLFRFHRATDVAPPLAFADRRQRMNAWAGLLQDQLRRDGTILRGAGATIELVEADVADQPTQAQVAAVRQIAARTGRSVNLDALTFAEASAILSQSKQRTR